MDTLYQDPRCKLCAWFIAFADEGSSACCRDKKMLLLVLSQWTCKPSKRSKTSVRISFCTRRLQDLWRPCNQDDSNRFLLHIYWLRTTDHRPAYQRQPFAESSAGMSLLFLVVVCRFHELECLHFETIQHQLLRYDLCIAAFVYLGPLMVHSFLKAVSDAVED